MVFLGHDGVNIRWIWIAHANVQFKGEWTQHGKASGATSAKQNAMAAKRACVLLNQIEKKDGSGPAGDKVLWMNLPLCQAVSPFDIKGYEWEILFDSQDISL